MKNKLDTTPQIINSTKQTWEIERFYEMAKDAYGSLISSRSAWISEESKKTNPNTSLITKWQNEQGDYFHEQRKIHSLGDAELKTLIDKLNSVINSEKQI